MLCEIQSERTARPVIRSAASQHSNSQDRYETDLVCTAPFVSIAKTCREQSGSDVMLGCPSFLICGNTVPLRLDRADPGVATIATIVSHSLQRIELLVTTLLKAVARTPCVAQSGRVGSNCKGQDNGENREPLHGDFCLMAEQNQRQYSVCPCARNSASTQRTSAEFRAVVAKIPHQLMNNF